ncbi:contact-dependent growth inhibition system immunity protein [Paenibacillus filicis]|uniref:Contact-dependent growth inhibition system immunity protein n=1 Tax=Paenibacillus filicis TaxID=669464 RepID=A0ABU9DIA4_9BACL
MGNPLVNFDTTKSLQELDGGDWGKPTYTSDLVKRVHHLRIVPLKDFTNEDLRLMIGQNVA